MDFKREPTKKSALKKYWYAVPAVLVAISAYFLTDLMGDASYIVDKSDLITAKVEKGNFKVNVRATGVLKPLNIRWVSSQVAGKVERVFVKAGAHVKQGDVLVELSNPELHRELEKARWELEANNAESHAAYVSLESQLVDLENAILSAEMSYQSAKLKLDAETRLIEQGNATVSAIDYQKSQLQVNQQMQHWQAQQQKAEKMRANMAATKLAQQARTGLVKNNFQRVSEQVESLKVKASTSGVVQKVNLIIGERAQTGDSVALIADQKSLFAELQVEEVRARDIAIGQLVSIDTRTSEMIGEVTRIDPAVSGGMVLVDVQLTSELPNEARPELTVDGKIEISNIDNALFVKRPVFAPSNSQIGLYKLTQDQQFARKHPVNFGISSVNKIQILSGLSEGDQIIISDTSDWQEHQDILIN